MKKTKVRVIGVICAVVTALTGCSLTQNTSDTIKETETQTINFVDAAGNSYEMQVNPKVEKNPYWKDCFVHDGDLLSYQGDDRYTYRLGVDVSHHQADIDWESVAASGMKFAFVRLGYRGYGKEGTMHEDSLFEKNFKQAQAAGLDVGVYFFSQAVTEAEAKEEADFVIEHLKGKNPQLPVVFDPETITEDEARTDNVSGEQFTKNAMAFCKEIKQAGYEPMIYCNMMWQAYELDLGKLTDYPIWYADYREKPQTPYKFTYWQYTNSAEISGISGSADVDIQMIPAGK